MQVFNVADSANSNKGNNIMSLKNGFKIQNVGNCKKSKKQLNYGSQKDRIASLRDDISGFWLKMKKLEPKHLQKYEISNKKTNRIADDKKGIFYICAIIKDEHEYIREWVLHNKSLGFNNIILYDNNSIKSYDSELGDMIADNFVRIRQWPDSGKGRQINAYNHFVRSGPWSDNDYCAFIDPDEFIFFDEAKTISEFMKMYSCYSGVGLSWRTYNAGGRIESPNGKLPTTKAYTTEFEYWGPRIKMIGRLTNIEHVFSTHAFRPKKDCPPLITTEGEIIANQDPHYKDYTNGHIKHYITKSWQDWIKRLKRGNITEGLRKVDTFFKFNPDLEHLRYELTKDLDNENS